MGTPEPLPFRIGHDERERAVQALGEHFAKGRLEPEEFEDRVAKAYTARTAAELDVLFQDLPRPVRPAPSQVPRLHTPTHPAAYDPSAPYGRDPATGVPYSDRSKVLAGVLQLFFGAFGVGRFYTGHSGVAVAQLLFTLVTFGAGAIWGFVDGIVLLAGRPRDKQGRILRG